MASRVSISGSLRASLHFRSRPTRRPLTLMEIATEKASLSLSVPQLHMDQPMALRKLRAEGQVLGPVLFTEVQSIGSSTRDGWASNNRCGRSGTNVCTTASSFEDTELHRIFDKNDPAATTEITPETFPTQLVSPRSSVLEEHQLSMELSLGLQPWAHVGAPGTSRV